MQSGQIGRPQFEQETLVSRDGMSVAGRHRASDYSADDRARHERCAEQRVGGRLAAAAARLAGDAAPPRPPSSGPGTAASARAVHARARTCCAAPSPRRAGPRPRRPRRRRSPAARGRAGVAESPSRSSVADTGTAPFSASALTSVGSARPVSEPRSGSRRRPRRRAGSATAIPVAGRSISPRSAGPPGSRRWLGAPASAAARPRRARSPSGSRAGSAAACAARPPPAARRPPGSASAAARGSARSRRGGARARSASSPASAPSA